MYLKWNLFKSYCIDHNIQLLKGDFDHIERQLEKIQKNLHRSVLKGFTDLWIKVLEEQENALQAQNLARRISNNWIREECDKLKDLK